MMATTTENRSEVRVIIGQGMWLETEVTTPADAKGVILFAHGSGSSRLSPRNQLVARCLNEEGFATVLADLLTSSEERVEDDTGRFRFDIRLLARRVERLIEWMEEDPETAALPVGLFGSSTGAAAVLDAAASRPDRVRALVSRGGRPDLATRLEHVKVPTLLIVGGDDRNVLRMNESALRRLNCVKRLTTVPGATHLFEEPGALERVAALAGRWFKEHLPHKEIIR